MIRADSCSNGLTSEDFYGVGWSRHGPLSVLLISFKDLAEKVELKLPLPIICPVFKTWDKSQG